MATFAQISKAALQLILTQESEGDYSASEYQDTQFGLNNMMAAWESEGIKLGFTEVSSNADNITVPPGAIRGIIANLAVEMAPQFDADITPSLSYQAKEGMKVCRILGQTIQPTRMPTTLPIGSGHYPQAFRTSRFYPEPAEGTYYATKDPDAVRDFPINWSDILDVIGDTISTSTWSADTSSGLVVDSDSNTTTTATATVSGGDNGYTGELTNRIVTAGGKTYDRTYIVDIGEK